MNGIHIFVFCCAEYKDLVDYCIQSIQKYVTDSILSINLVSNLKIQVDGVNLILDQDFWKLLDPDWKHRKLYNANWTKQQIFKLAVDNYVTGNVLIVDAEILFLKPTRWIENEKTNYYTSFSPRYDPYFALNKKLVGIDRLSQHSFIADTMVFSTKILQSIRTDIETLHQRPWLDVFDTLIIDTPGNALSEFELYGNYVLANYSNLIGKLDGPIQHGIFMNNRQEYPFDVLIEMIKQRSDNNFLSVNINTHSYTKNNTTSWLSFYEQVRDPSWPDCDNEEEFDKLPEHIKEECIGIFGYAPKSSSQ
jgi:hypothetical protein